MRQVFAHDAVLVMDADQDQAVPGATITVALCGHWEHEPPCPLAPHHVQAERDGDQVHLRILFATEPGYEAEVRERLHGALSGQIALPPDATQSGQAAAWQLLHSAASGLRADEAEHAEHLRRA